MVPKVLVFKSGERVIAGASEMTDKNTGKGICLGYQMSLYSYSQSKTR